jgi:hypothetical protein
MAPSDPSRMSPSEYTIVPRVETGWPDGILTEALCVAAGCEAVSSDEVQPAANPSAVTITAAIDLRIAILLTDTPTRAAGFDTPLQPWYKYVDTI